MKCFLYVVNIEKYVFQGYMKKIFVHGIEGMLNIYPGHSPLLTLIKPGLLHITTEDMNDIFFYISNGILEVQPDIVHVLSDIIIHTNDLNYLSMIREKKKIIKKMDLCTSIVEKKFLKNQLLQISQKIRISKIINSKP
ncbi:ATP synthase epsilon chain [Buchnera aphidicola (Pterocallis alni)]|uniref:ATP synthase F1 subunit epsilon n=1 Tax=Buchnera aphidicola TaxID=9 RepID=UPI00346435DA